MIKKYIHSFTLIEILVSLAIIGIVIALIIPGVQSVRCNAQVVKCISNLRQLGIASVMYEQDYDALPGSLAEVIPYKKSRYAESSEHLLEHSFAIKSAHAQYLAPYYQNNQEILKCPAAPDREVGYALNAYVAGKATSEFQNMDIMLMADSTYSCISSIKHVDFRHCKHNRANAVTTRLNTVTFTEDSGAPDLKPPGFSLGICSSCGVAELEYNVNWRDPFEPACPQCFSPEIPTGDSEPGEEEGGEESEPEEEPPAE